VLHHRAWSSPRRTPDYGYELAVGTFLTPQSSAVVDVADVPFIIGGRGPASLHHVITDAPGWTERLYLLRYLSGNVAIEIGPEGDSLDEYLDKATPILRSLRFAKR
jgi:hypothetical protein